MKKSKILVPAMAVLALGMAGTATATVAWFQSTVQVVIEKDVATMGGLTVDATTADGDELDATVHFIYSIPDKNIELTTWSGSDLKKGVVPQGGTVSDVRLVDAAIADETYEVTVKAYITDESSEAEKQQVGHDVSWAAALDAKSTEKKNVKFSYSSSDVAGKLNTDEVYFYTNTSAETSPKYAKASEGISNASGKTQALDVSISQLKVSGSYVTTAGSAVTIGYLYVRFEGSTRLHSGSYSATLSATGGNGAAAANS